MPIRPSDAMRHSIPELKSLGFSEYEARIYVSLIGAAPSTAYELAKTSGVPRPNSYSALASLVDRGAAMPVSDNPARYVARDPRELLSTIATRTKTTCEELAEHLTQVSAPKVDDYVWNLEGGPEIDAKLSSMIDNAREVIWIKAGPEVIRPHKDALATATTERNVNLRIILFGDDANEFLLNEKCEVYVHEGSGVRMGTADNLFTITVDHDEMLTANESDGIRAAYTQNQAVVKMALSLIRHDYYMSEIFMKFKDQIDEAFGPHLLKLRGRSYTPEQFESFKHRTGTNV